MHYNIQGGPKNNAVNLSIYRIKTDLSKTMSVKMANRTSSTWFFIKFEC